MDIATTWEVGRPPYTFDRPETEGNARITTPQGTILTEHAHGSEQDNNSSSLGRGGPWTQLRKKENSGAFVLCHIKILRFLAQLWRTKSRWRVSQ